MATAAAGLLAVTLVQTRATASDTRTFTPIACPQQTWEFAEPTFDALPGAKAYFGRYDGGLYRVEIPERWNGELVLNAHGFRSNGGPDGNRLSVGLPSTMREHLSETGFAWAASSYRCNGYVPGIGLQDTMALRDLFTRHNGGRPPQRVYLTGTSMGGHVTLLGMHEFPTGFDGALAMCPAGPELFDFFTGTAAAAEVITGVSFTSPATLGADAARMAEALGRFPDLTERGRQLASVQINLTGGPRPFAMDGLESRFLQNISASALAGSSSPQNRAVSTTHLRYTVDEALGLKSTELNAAVRRKAADPEYRSAGSPFDELVPFDGHLQRPVMTMHGTGDLFVPIHLEQTLRRAAEAAGTTNLLVQRIYRIGGHCRFSPAEEATAFDDLVRWVRDGTKPAGDDVMGDLTDAGRTFTNPLRPGDPGLTAPRP
jgi:pimeloyl-ACP methyl ester carboxylesterase